MRVFLLTGNLESWQNNWGVNLLHEVFTTPDELFKKIEEVISDEVDDNSLCPQTDGLTEEKKIAILKGEEVYIQIYYDDSNDPEWIRIQTVDAK